MFHDEPGDPDMHIEPGFARDVPTRRIGWFPRLAQQRRWFHESLFRTPHVERKPGPKDLPARADIDTRKPSE